MMPLHGSPVARNKTCCCIAGGGPAGMMLGFLLARAGVKVEVLEKHADFFRDFRGDTIHPSTLELMHELGILEDFLRQPHQEAEKFAVLFEGAAFTGPDFSHLPTRCKFIALMPQWDFLNFIASQAKQYPGFHLRMKTEVTGLIEENGRVTGVKAKTEEGELEVHADLVVACDGRHSTTREQAGLETVEFGVPIDVLWFRVPKSEAEDTHFLGRIKNGRMMVTLDRGDYFQVGFIIRKGTFDEIKAKGLEAFQESIVSIVPGFSQGVKELDDWEKVKLLTVQINRLRQWHRPGFLCIGDAAHAMSPAGGVGINYAIQDAVATANLLAPKLLRGDCDDNDLESIQKRREWPVSIIQRIQVFLHRRMFPEKAGARPFHVSWPLKKILILFAPLLRRMGGYIIGIGFRPEHIARQ